jgi:enoyl-CoA hydratase/carnithine racemase
VSEALVRWASDGDVGRLTLARPAKRNALSAAMVDEACRAMDDLVGAGARIVVLDAEGPVFCAGADLAEARLDLAAPAFERLVDALLESGVFVVGAVAGPALGAGVALAAVCPVVVCSSDAWFSLPEHTIGLFPSIVLAYLEEHVGPRRGLRMGLTGERLGAEEAASLGLVTDVVPPERLDAAVAQWIDVLRRDARVTDDARRAWRARFARPEFTARRRDLGRIIAS